MPRRASAASAQALSMLFGTDETESAAQRAADAEAAHAAAAAAAGVMLDAIMPAEDVADVRNEPPAPQPPAPQPAAAAVQPSKGKARATEGAGPRAKRKAPAAAPATSKRQQPKQPRKIVVVESNGTEMFQELRRLAPMGGHAKAPGSEPLELKSYAQRLMKAMSAPGAMRLYADWKRSAP